jgi:hypothetical protein
MDRSRAWLALAWLAAAAVPLHAAVPGCNGAQSAQFDFWIGDWDAYDADDPKTPSARVTVTPILEHCSLHEVYEGPQGLKGESLSSYDAGRRRWHQTWVTNHGDVLLMDGASGHGAVSLTGEDALPGGRQRRVRVEWRPMDGGVRETAQRSTDGGRHWTPWFDILFRPHRP